MAQGRYPVALDYHLKAQELLENHGKGAETSYGHLGVAQALSRMGDFTGATAHVRKALALREGRDDTEGEAIARLAVAENYLQIGRLNTALEEARKAHFQLSLVSAEGHLADAEALIGRIHVGHRQ